MVKTPDHNMEDDTCSTTNTETIKSDTDDNSDKRMYDKNSWPNLINPNNWLPLTWATSNYWGLNAPSTNATKVLEEMRGTIPHQEIHPATSSLAFQAASHQLLNGLFWDSFAMKALDGTNGLQNLNLPTKLDTKPVINNLSIPSPSLDKGLLFPNCLGPESLLFRPGVVSFPSPRSNRNRSEKRPIPDELKDSRYYERRKRNNLAAKKSRDARKAREDEVALRACYLEKENAVLRAQVGTLREEAQALRQLLILQKKNGQCPTAQNINETTA